MIDGSGLRVELIQTICRLPAERLPQAAEALRRLELAQPLPIAVPAAERTVSGCHKDWPHAPLHRLVENGTYMVTTGTHNRAHVFHDAARLTLLEDSLLRLASEYGWNLEAWAVFSNHYHFVGSTLASPSRLKEFLTQLHADTAREVNQLDGTKGRQVWHNFWDKQLTYEKSYLARLSYVHQNSVKHGLTRVANQYRWCSAAWFERTARPAAVKTIYGFKTDRLKVPDDFEPLVIQ
jgi:putative transposase